MCRSARAIPYVFLVLASMCVPAQAGAPDEAMPAGSGFSLNAGHFGAADKQRRRSTCFELRGEAGPGLAGTGSGGSGRWSVQHGFWAAAGAARGDTLFFDRFEDCHP